ncbi:MAG: flagellar biosynthesis anti-sigma factor FlgM [Bdellovibrionales bacterium]|nr:flagellar biosynthesis anti-sigma factor FlgM [Bdellovibrionales bacterium]
MKVGNSNVQPNLADLKKASDKTDVVSLSSKKGPRSPVDLESSAKVNVSQMAKDSSRISEIARNAPDVDAEKVAKFKALINSGQYSVNAKAIADKMVDQELDMAKLEK